MLRDSTPEHNIPTDMALGVQPSARCLFGRNVFNRTFASKPASVKSLEMQVTRQLNTQLVTALKDREQSTCSFVGMPHLSRVT